MKSYNTVDRSELAYEPVLEQAPLDMKFHEYNEVEEVDKITGEVTHKNILDIRVKGFLISSLDQLRKYAEKCKGREIAVDTETTGICYRDSYIVGFSIAYDAYNTGIYVPIRHQVKKTVEREEPILDENGVQKKTKAGKLRVKKVKDFEYSDSPHNLPAKEALDILYEIMVNAKVVYLHNSEFDMNMIKKEGYDVMKANTFDTIILPYLFDAENKSGNGLKFLEKRLLGRYVPEFKDALGGEENFQYTDPTQSYSYACYDKETDVLTENGWVKWPEYNGTDKLATVNPDTEKLEYQTPTKLYKYVYNGKMECTKTNGMDYCVTPNHNMVVARGQNPDKGWLFKRADELNVEEVAMTAPRNFDSTGNKFITINGNKYESIKMAKLSALVIADGCTCKRTESHRGYTISVSTCKDKNYSELENVLLDSPFKWHKYSVKNRPNMVTWECYDKDLWEWLAPYVGNGSLNKKVPKDIYTMTKESIEGFLQVYAWTDGHVYGKNTQYYSISKYIVDGIQHLLMLVGRRSSTYIRTPKDSYINGKVVEAENCHPVYYVKTTGEKTKRYQKRSRFQIDYNDYVYCAEVPNHTLITRRNGSTLVAGNCYDVTGTYGVYKKLRPRVDKLLKVYEDNVLIVDNKRYNVIEEDNNLIRSFIDYYGHCKLKVDKQVAIDYKEKILKDLAEVKEKIYTFFDGKVFNLNKGSKEFKGMMAEYNIDTGVKTDTGNICFSDDGLKGYEIDIKTLKNISEHLDDVDFTDGVLNKVSTAMSGKLARIIENHGSDYFYFKWDKTKNKMAIGNKLKQTLKRDEFINQLTVMIGGESKKLEVLKAIKEHGSLMKALNSYIDKLTKVDECRMRYRLQSTASGRLSSGNSEKSSKVHNNYYIDLNAQNLTKPHSCLYKAEESNEYGNIMGWKFTPVTKEYADEHPEEYIVEGAQQESNIRRCIVAPSGVYKIYEPCEDGSLIKRLFKIKLNNGSEIIRTKGCLVAINKDEQRKITKEDVVSVEPLGEMKCKEVIIEGFEKLPEYNNIFDELVAESRYVLSCDYSSEEYITLATLSRDSVMLDNFRNGIDPHTASAWAIWGKENYCKEYRKKAKIFNFANNYGGTEYAISSLLEISPEEARTMVENYNNTFEECSKWKANMISTVIDQYNYVAYNAFGRPRQFSSLARKSNEMFEKGNELYGTEEYKERMRISENIDGGIKRRIISHIIQSSCGDICRLDLLKLYTRFFKNRDPNIDFMSTVHDQIDFSVAKSKIVEYAREVEDLMRFDLFDKELPIEVGIEVGDSLGMIWPFVWEDETRTRLIPERF